MTARTLNRPIVAAAPVRSAGLVAFLGWAFAITWILVAPIAASKQGWIPIDIGSGWHALGALGPLLAAILVSRRTAGGLQGLAAGLARWRVSPWFWLAALSPALFLVPAAAIVRMTGGEWPDLAAAAASPRLAEGGWLQALLVPAIAYGLGEEIGWRGFALPRLQARFRPLPAALVLGVVWLAWHVPFYLYREGMVNVTPAEMVAQALVLVIGSLFLVWLYNSTGGSILLCAIWHFTHSVVHVAVPEVSQSWDTWLGVFGTVLALLVTAIWWRRMSASQSVVHDHAVRRTSR